MGAATLASLPEAGLAVRDHSARMAKKPVTFSAICRASSSVRLRSMRDCQTLRVCFIRLFDRFIEDFTYGLSPLVPF
jgi:hypothetical protein